MRVKCSDLARGRRRFDFEIDPDDLTEAVGDRRDVAGPIEARVGADAENVDRTINISGRIDLRFRATCSRCAEEFDARLGIPWNLILVPARERPGPQIDDLGFGYYSGDWIDLARLALDGAGLFFPEILLCKPECKGLCTGCLANLNVENCRCK